MSKTASKLQQTRRKPNQKRSESDDKQRGGNLKPNLRRRAAGPNKNQNERGARKETVEKDS